MDKFPDLNELIAPRLTKVGKFISSLFKQLHYESPSEHFTGAAATLDKTLYDQPQLPFVLNHNENPTDVYW